MNKNLTRDYDIKKRVHISTPEFANKLCEICTPYTKEFDIDIVRGRCVLDASSILGITSMLGNDVDVIPHTNNRKVVDELFKKIAAIKDKYK
ncbi:hypothetical protein C823_007722 [Eubacterium plexicaudatum ASF492]|uniref:HPr domain-containing protein n=1 Tax=Eubacterium plexicaudatum ASF492 TaxID=1235802 RepID=N2A4S0_9FIRM|nr:hypothetical protein C823_007722 [Eubacterium plexicaudatum ASF492]